MRPAGLFAIACIALAQTPPETYHLGPTVSMPRLLHKQEPTYPEAARKQALAGTLVLEIVVSEQGRATDINVLSPLGFGFDEEAIKAVEKWTFAPGIKDGKPVRVYATVEVNFRIPGADHLDEKLEKKRTEFNIALHDLSKSARDHEKSVKTMQDLARQQYAPAQFTVGTWKISGEFADKNPAEGLALIQKSADENYAPALYEIATREIDGTDLPKDLDKGIETMKHAAILGSAKAQYNLGQRYQSGIGVELDTPRARRYFHVCATAKIAACQLALAKSILTMEKRTERDYVQAIAWLELAAAQDVKEASQLLERENSTVSDAQRKWAESIKPNLLRR